MNSPTRPDHRTPHSETRVHRRLDPLFIKLGVAVLICLLFGFGVLSWQSSNHEPLPEITAVASRAELPITVTERGELESSKTVDVRCEVEGEQLKIVELTPEGTRVGEGEIVARPPEANARAVYDSSSARRHSGLH